MKRLVLGAALSVAACATSDPLDEAMMASIDVPGALAACCESEPKMIGPEFVAFFEQNSAAVPLKLRAGKLRTAYVEAQPEAQAALIAGAQPMDVIVTRNKSRLSGLFGVGYFTHAGLYLGTEAQLRALGVWHHPLVIPFQDEIRRGAVMAEVTERGVHMSHPVELLEADMGVLLRPDGFGKPCRAAGALDTFRLMGRPFDYDFAAHDGDDALYCTELVAMVMPQLALSERQMFGRMVILPDEIVAHALAGKVPMSLVRGVEGYPVGWRYLDENAVAARILGTQPHP